MEPIKMGILGAGGIARRMADTIRQMPNVIPYAIASRDKGKADAYASEYGFEKSFGSYEEMADDGGVQLAYVATPHSHHYAHARLLLEHDIPVLCEKAFTANAREAESLMELSHKRGVLLAEAIWPRYMPLAKVMRTLLDSGVLGSVNLLTAEFGYPLMHVRRLFDPALAGGALLDLGVYALTFASILFGSDVERVVSTAAMLPTGVDKADSITLVYKDGRMAVLSVNMAGCQGNTGAIFGDKARMEITNVNNYERARVVDAAGRELLCYDRPPQITGFEYEVDACCDALRQGRLECPDMPHAEILRIMQLMDSLRASWGVRYPFEA